MSRKSKINIKVWTPAGRVLEEFTFGADAQSVDVRIGDVCVTIARGHAVLSRTSKGLTSGTSLGFNMIGKRLGVKKKGES